MRVRESAVDSLLSPTTQTLFTNSFIPDCVVTLNRPIDYNQWEYIQWCQAKPISVGSWPRAITSRGRGGSGDQAHPPRQRDQPQDVEMMQRQGEEKKMPIK